MSDAFADICIAGCIEGSARTIFDAQATMNAQVLLQRSVRFNLKVGYQRNQADSRAKARVNDKIVSSKAAQSSGYCCMPLREIG